MGPDNPFLDALRFERRAPPCAIVIFGANGDLTKRKLMPALYRLAYERRIPPTFAVIGNSRTAMDDDQFREKMRESVEHFLEDSPFETDLWDSFAKNLFYIPGDLNDTGLYKKLADKLEELQSSHQTAGNVLFYLSTQPSYYGPVVKCLGEAKLQHGDGWRRVVIEKPFGHDLKSARALDDEIHHVFPEKEVYRIDHYLGKETVQNILVLRFANGIFEPIWNRQYVDHVQITVAESLGIEERGAYYEQAGALRDIVQNHLLQLVALVGMEPPVSFDAKAVRDEKLKVLRAIRPISLEDTDTNVVRGQYGAGFVEGTPVRGYREEDGIASTSKTETFLAIRAYIDNWRWEGTPFYFRTGKRLPKRTTEIAIQFRAAPHAVFSSEAAEGMEPNALVLRIQPDEGISLKFGAKVPVQGIRIRSVNMDFVYGASFMVDAPDAYETLILDALRGDATLFTRQDEVEQQWRFVDPIARAWTLGQSDLPTYPAGTWGPIAADLLIARDGRTWRKP
jgi:glucose-6-phosphate 1-dehydrogenase